MGWIAIKSVIGYVRLAPGPHTDTCPSPLHIANHHQCHSRKVNVFTLYGETSAKLDSLGTLAG